jgi:hypothetical protein
LRAAYHRLLGPSILFLIVVLFYWKLVLTNQYTWLEGPDAANLNLPWLQFQAGEWHNGRFPLWDPNGWFGQPLLGQAQPGAAYPPNWVLFLFPLKHGWIRQAALHWYFVLTRYFAALACYALARDLRRSRGASILAGCVYGLGGYVAVTVAPQMVNGAVWTPLVFLYLFRAERGERPLASALLSGFFLGFGWLAGHHQMNLFVTMAAVGLWIWLAVREGKLNWRIGRLAAVSLCMAVLASAFQTIPTAEYGRRAVRWVGMPDPVQFNQVVPYTMHEEYSEKPLSALGIFLPGIDSRFGLYVGTIAFAMGVLGAILAWRERQAPWLVALALGGLFFTLGPNSVFHGVLYSLIPLVEKARVPAAGSIVFSIGLAPLVAYAADLLPRPENASWVRRAGWVLAAFSALAATIGFILFAAKVQVVTDDRLLIAAIASVLGAAIFAGWRNGGVSPRAGLGCVTGLVLFELFNVSTYPFPNRYQPDLNRYLPPLAQHSDLVDYVRKRGEAARIEYDDNVIPYNIGDWYGVETFNAYVASVPLNIWKMDLFSPEAKDFFDIKYYFGKSAPRKELEEVFSGKSDLKVFENPNAFPRVWSVHQSVSARAPGFNPRRTVLVDPKTNPKFGSCLGGEDDVQMPMHLPNYVRITADLHCRGMVILTDTWFPGWRATVDRKPAEIYQVYGGVRGVMVDGGRHVIEMRYLPWSVLVGGALTLVAAVVAVVAARRGADNPVRQSLPEAGLSAGVRN